jgi:hypothetical protein
MREKRTSAAEAAVSGCNHDTAAEAVPVVERGSFCGLYVRVLTGDEKAVGDGSFVRFLALV